MVERRRMFTPDWRSWLRAAAVGAVGPPLLMGFLVTVWAPVDRSNPGMTSIPVVVLLAMPIGLLAGTVSRGIGGFVIFWLAALTSTFAVVAVFGQPGLAAIASLMAIIVVPQAVLPGYVVASLIGAARSASGQPAARSFLRSWLVPSVASFAVIGLIAFSNAAVLRGGRQSSCAALQSGVAAAGRIAFAGSHALCIADLTTRAVTMAYGSSTDVDETLRSVRWAPDGSAVALIREVRPLRGQRTSDLALVHLDGSPPTVVPIRSQLGAVRSVDWAPDGTRLIVAADRSGCSACGELYVVDVAAGTWTRLPVSGPTTDITYPAWSPAGDRLVIDAGVDDDETVYGRSELRVIGLDGRVRATIATDADNFAPASWSPDGRRIAFGRRGEPGVDVFVANSDGSGVIRLTTVKIAAGNYASTARPMWSPDGTTLAVSIYLSNELPHAISLMPAAGGPATLLLEGASDYDWLP